jgi:hypothetical protein
MQENGQNMTYGIDIGAIWKLFSYNFFTSIRRRFLMEKGIVEIMHSDSKTAEAPKREVITLADFEKVSLTDVHSMFGTWKETDHCDKDIQS